MDKYTKLSHYSDPAIVMNNAKKYLGNDIKVYISTRPTKKYMIQRPDKKFIHFGQFNPPMEDFTKHQDKDRQRRYLARATNIKGNWKNDKYSANNLSLRILWNWNGKNTI